MTTIGTIESVKLPGLFGAAFVAQREYVAAERATERGVADGFWAYSAKARMTGEPVTIVPDGQHVFRGTRKGLIERMAKMIEG